MKVEVNNVSIKYRAGNFRDIGLKEYIVRKIKGTLTATDFLAVDGVTFSLREGDFLGIVGTNGAGKSTLLKAVSGVLRPSSGTIDVEGKIAALLELGTGFDGDLSLKENIYMRGAILGYTREFMDSKYEEILEYAELTEYKDRLFKQLSSGMRSRLAFAISCLVEPEILILDEVFAVGDGAFRIKSEATMNELLSKGNITILVSHATGQIRKLCNKVLWLDKGKQIAFGEAKTVCDKYEKYLKTVANLQKRA